MEILLSMRNQSYRTRNNSLFILNLFALQFISLISLNRLSLFYLKIAQLVLIVVDDNWSFSSLCVLINLGFNVTVLIMFAFTKVFHTFKYRQSIIKVIGYIILNFKYVMLIPVGCINVRPLINPQVTIEFKVICAFNMAITFVLSAVELYTNWSNRFIEKDYCNRRENSILCLFFQFGFVFSTIILGSLVGSLFLIAVSIFRAYQVSITVEYPMIQSSTFFYSSLNIYMCVIFLIGEGRLGFLELTCKIIIGVIVSSHFSQAACNFINTYYGNSKNLYRLNKGLTAQKSDKQNPEIEQENKLLNNYKDMIVLSRIVLNRNKVIKNPQDRSRNEWEIWWQKYILVLTSHKITCANQKCDCRRSNDEEVEFRVVMDDMRKYMHKLEEEDKSLDIRIMGIYLNVEIINKPLKAYYEIIRMSGEEASVTNSVDIQCLITQTRECFSRIFLLNNILNSNLPLMKIIKFEELIQSLEGQIKQALEANINFNELFTLNSVKIIQVINESKRIFEFKEKIGDKLEDLMINYPDSFRVSFFIFIFYQYLEPYRSRQKQFKIISQQKNLKRRLFEKEDQDIFSPEQGVIYIDMVQERGKIRKITKNVCQLFGHNYEDMISFNINQFMPQIFSRHHHKFLSNFIQYGKIKILSQKKRLIFAKNKIKFIFPIYVRMKTEHLLHDEFGVTALIKKMDTNSDFIIFGPNGKIQQMTERIYKTVFYSILKTEVDKTRRLCLIKMIPQIVQLINQPNFQSKCQNVHQSLFIFSNQVEMLQKFKTYKEPRQHDSAYQSSISYVASTELEQTTQASVNGNIVGLAYFSQVFKTFLNDLNIIKLVSYLITYKISKLKTQEFSVYLLEIISIQLAESPFLSAIDEYKKISENLGIYEEYGSINENFEKYRHIIEQTDVLNFMFNKNVPSQSFNKMPRRNEDRGYRRKIITIMDAQNNPLQPESLPQDSQMGKFNEMANMKNQPELMQRGGSERSSITDQTQSQSKKQMLINAFNTDNIRVSTKLLLFINIAVIVKFGVLLAFVIISIEGIDTMFSQELKNVMNLSLKQVFEYRLAADQIGSFYELAKSRNYTVEQSRLADLQVLKQKLNYEFTQNLITVKKISQYASSGEKEIYQLIQIYDPHLKASTKITLVELLNELDFIFRSETANNQSNYFEFNYVKIHNKFQQVCLSDIEATLAQKASSNQTPLIILGLYEFFIVTLALLWIPILFFVSKEEKRIINLLSTMNVRQLKRVTHKLRILLQNMKTSRIKQINEMLGLLNDEKVENVIEMEKQKSITRNIRLVEEQGSYTVKPKIVAAFIFAFMVIFSILPITMHFNLLADNEKYHNILHVMQETSMLADKVPILANIYVTNLNKVYSSQQIKEFPLHLYESAESDYFKLTELISKADDISKNLVYKTGANENFSDLICLEIECSNSQKQTKVKFYDKILLIRNSFSILGPKKLNLIKKMSKSDIDKWVNQTNAIETMGWMSKIYRFAHLWNNRFKQQIEKTLGNTKQRLIILASILVPAYILAIVYIELWLIKKLSKILKNAETIHMHFPVQILAENTYLTSYFNDKIKNSK